METIQFTGKHRFLNLAERKQIRSLLGTTAKKHSKTIQSLQYVFVSDGDLHKINLEFLNHDTLTDIITFDLDTTETAIDGSNCDLLNVYWVENVSTKRALPPP